MSDIAPVPDWHEQGLCRQTDPEIFFPEPGANIAPAKRVCMACPSRELCLEDALERDEAFGLWGGLTRRQRLRLQAKRDREAAAEVAA